MNQRKQKAIQMSQTIGYASQFESDKFRVRSQTDHSKSYIISKTSNGLKCECKDHLCRKADCKHIKIVLEIIMKNKCFKDNTFRIMERSKLKLCKYCDSGKIIKKGTRKNKSGDIQIFKCLDCKKRFTANFGFEKMRYDYRTITGALQMYYSGMSVRDIENHYEMLGIDVDHSSIYDWICKYSTMVSKYLNEIVPRTSERVMVRADEVWIKINGKQNYLFASMEDDTRYWLASDMAETKFQHNADTLLKLTKEAIGRNPVHFVTDGLRAYMKSSKKIFGIKSMIPFEHFYTITPTNFIVLSEYKQKRKLNDFFSLLKQLDKEIMITLERTPITVNHKGKDTKMNVLQVLIDSIDPLDDILEKIGFSFSIDGSDGETYPESHQQININKESSKMFSLSSIDKNYGRAYTLYKNPSRLPAAWIHTVFAIFDKIRIHISPVLPDKAMSKIDNKELLYIDNKSQKADIQKKIADIKLLKHDLELGNNMIFDVTINGFVFADTKPEILKLHQDIIKNLNSINVRMTTSMGQQQNIINGDGVSWIYDIESTSILYPFSSSDMLEIPNGILLGINKDTGSPVIYDPDYRANHNIFAAGTTGSGKSFTMKIIVKRFLEKRPDIMTVIIDPQGEYLPHAKYFGLDTLEIKPGKQYGLDPFKLFDTPIEAADIIGIVTEAPIEVKKEWRSICDGIKNLDELYKKSSEKAKKYLEDLVKGSMSEIFKGDIKFSDRMIISLKHLDGQEYEGLFILLALTYAWKRVNALPSNQWKFLLLDEAWRMTKLAKSAYKIGEIGRQGRKKSLIFAISTQQFTDLDKSLDDESKLTELFDTKIIMGMSKTAAEKTGAALDLTADEIERIKNFKPGNGLLQTGTNSIYIKFEGTSDEEKIYFSTTEKKIVN